MYHPLATKAGVGNGFSDADYLHLLSDSEQLGMIMTFGDYDFLVLKTSVTPNNLQPDSISRRLDDAIEDFFESDNRSKFGAYQRATNFNKEVCSEFGLTLYIATPQNRDLAERVEVTK